MPDNFHLTINTTVQEVSDYLVVYNIPISSIKTANSEEDAKIIVNEHITIQVGCGYAIVYIVTDDDMFWIGRKRNNIKDVIKDVKKGLKPILRIVNC